MDWLNFLIGLHEQLKVDIPESDYAKLASSRYARASCCIGVRGPSKQGHCRWRSVLIVVKSGAGANAMHKQRLSGIERDLPRGAPPVKVDVARLVALTTESKPEAATHWSTRTMAAATRRQCGQRFRVTGAPKGLKPHLVRGFKVSRDPKFIEKLEDVWACIYRRPNMPLCCAAMRKVRCRRLIALSLACL